MSDEIWVTPEAWQDVGMEHQMELLKKVGGFQAWREYSYEFGDEGIIPELHGIEELTHHPAMHPEGSHLNHMIEVFNAFRRQQDRNLCYGIFKLSDRETETDLFERTAIRWTDYELALWCLLFHDIGKQSCAKLNENTGYHSYIKHESVGANIFRDKYALFFEPSTAAVIEWVIRKHMDFWQVGKHGKVTALATHEEFTLLAVVCRADKMGWQNKKWLVRMEIFNRKMKEEGCYGYESFPDLDDRPPPGEEDALHLYEYHKPLRVNYGVGDSFTRHMEEEE